MRAGHVDDDPIFDRNGLTQEELVGIQEKLCCLEGGVGSCFWSGFTPGNGFAMWLRN